jgi:hypothetical protein
MQPLEAAKPHPAISFVPGKPSGPARGDLEAPRISGFGVSCSHNRRTVGPTTARRSGGWRRTASAFAPAGAALLFGVALFVRVFWPKGGSTGARSAIMRPALVKIISSEEPPTALHVDASSAAPPSEQSSAGVAPPTTIGVLAAEPAPVRRSPPHGPQCHNPLYARPAPQDATTAHAAARAGDAAPLDAHQRPLEADPTVGSKIVSAAQAPTPNLDLPTKLPRKTSVRVAGAKTAATSPSARAGMRRQPYRPGASTISLTRVAPQTTAAPAAAQEPVNPMTRVLGAVLEASAVDQTASKSGDWAIQFAAPKSEAEAEATAARLNAKYAPALNGATIGVHKTQVNGETIYALRVAGLSKADAAALCVRVKGRDCSITK